MKPNELQADQVFVHPHANNDTDIRILSIVEGWVTAKKVKGHPFVYTRKDFIQVFIESSGYRLKEEQNKKRDNLIIPSFKF